ncbi:hypothetical protein [Legionella maioricensis]|uniref:Uncharacterized protein n=1 Tax=Legionella maioricensis TaxID=2896528 RepID=A0A9X2IDA1_9GAMM|nr:hypothetical protein [Legionella maioricensis]MCL9685327.1 hypothetical protein [Legionella maioricensis]MCL9688711.1 hypothetical protein [Legionella maioricensis]
MQYITEENMPIFQEATRLRDESIRLHKEWLAEVEESNKGRTSFEDTEPKFNEYLAATKKWKDFQDVHAEILLAKVQN